MLRSTIIAFGSLLGLALAAWGEGAPKLVDPHTTGSRLLLYRPGLLTYDNYGIEGYRPWPRNVLTRTANPVYDEFGQFLVNGVEVYRMQETRRLEKNPVSAFFEGSNHLKPANYDSYVNRLMVADDSYNAWHTRFIIGDRIRTHFSPLYLDLAALNGIRWDLANETQAFTVVSSRMDRPLFRQADVAALGTTQTAAYLLGGHWRGKFNTIEAAASYVNLFRIDSSARPNWNGMKGRLPKINSVIDYLVVRVDDSSILDGEGARVYDMHMMINGERRDDLQPFVTLHHREVFDLDYPNGDRRFPRGPGSIPPYIEAIQARNGVNTIDTFDPPFPEFFKADAKEYVLYWFPIPQEENDIKEASFEALVSGNYTISIAEVYALQFDARRDDPRARNESTYFNTVAGSNGRSSPGSDIRRVRFDYGRQTGVTITGVELKTAVKGFQFKSEWAHSFNYLKYPGAKPLCDDCPSGARHDRGGSAWFVNAERELSPTAAFGGEWFRLDPEYTTQLSSNDRSLARYTDPPGPYAGDLGTAKDGLNFTLDLNSVDDNDDKDPFPDNFFLRSFTDRNGVFPGLDKDLDGTPDTNRNFNSVPDYFEPFLLYDVDPDDFEYGEDLNNNGVIDYREDDAKPDYPYDLNRKGYHVFVRLRPQKRLELNVGRYDMAAIRGGMRSKVNYVKAEYIAKYPAIGQLRIVDFLKRVKDDIPDNVSRYGDITNFDIFTPRSTFAVFAEDRLLMRNSWVNTTFVEFTYVGIDNFFADANVQYEFNDQQGGRMLPSNKISKWTSVIRADYNWDIGEFQIAPRYKFMFRKRTDDESRVHQLNEMFSYPMLVGRYQFTENSWLRIGLQGFPGLPALYKNRDDKNQSYDTKDLLLMLINRFEYAGYDQVLTAGYRISQRDMENRDRSVQDINFEEFFINIIVGLEPVL